MRIDRVKCRSTFEPRDRPAIYSETVSSELLGPWSVVSLWATVSRDGFHTFVRCSGGSDRVSRESCLLPSDLEVSRVGSGWVVMVMVRYTCINSRDKELTSSRQWMSDL